jgi:SPP1 gp7 family putative phage head morphogenesis protein
MADVAIMYQPILHTVRTQAELLAVKIDEAREAGLIASPAWAYQQERWRLLEAQLVAELARFSVRATPRMEQARAEALALGVSQAKEKAQAVAMVTVWGSPSPRAVEQLIGATATGPLRDLLNAIGPDVLERMRGELVSGLALGRNPLRVATALTEASGIGQVRAATIARTEMMRSYRGAHLETYKANKDVVRGWIWTAFLDSTTCPVCWAMHGTEHGLDEELDGHPNCRCTPVPQTGEVITTTGVEQFAKLDVADQRKILGPGAYAAYERGDLNLSDLVGRRRSRRWGTTRTRRPLREILG